MSPALGSTLPGPALLVLAPGLHSTVQDLGRWGFQAIGVPVSGALDADGLRLANGLVGNPEGAAALELLFQGPALEVAASSVRVALAGAGAVIEILGEPLRQIPAWRSLRLERGQRFRIGALGEAAVAYLAVEGGIAVPGFLGSASTYVRGAIGGLEGRALRAGDALPLARAAAEPWGERRLSTPPEPGLARPIRVVLGPQDDHFTAAAVETFLTATYRVSANMDRMGMRLEGPALAHRDGYNIVSDGIATGAVQVPGSGQPILLLADHQTTGGYPKIATVISADLGAVGRRRPGSALRFAAVTVAEAEALRRAAEAALAAALAGLEPVPEAAHRDLEALYAENLVSGVVSAREDAEIL